MIEKEELKKHYRCSLPYDKRDPDPSKNYGVCGINLTFILEGAKGAVQFSVAGQAFLPHVQKERLEKDSERWPLSTRPGGLMVLDLGYHSPKPMYEGDRSLTDNCEFTKGGPCFYDGSTLNAQELADVIFSQVGVNPEDLMWKNLEKYYYRTFYSEE